MEEQTTTNLRWTIRPKPWLAKLLADYMTEKGITNQTEGFHTMVQALIDAKTAAPAKTVEPSDAEVEQLKKKIHALEEDVRAWQSWAKTIDSKGGQPRPSQSAAPAQSTPPPTAKPATPDHITKDSAIFQPPLECCYYGMKIAAATCELIQKKNPKRCKSVDCKMYRDAHPNEPPPPPKEFNPCAPDPDDESEEIIKEALDPDEPSVTDISNASAPPSTNITTPNEKPMCRWIGGTVVSIEYCINTQTTHSERCKNVKCPIYLGDATATKIEGLGVHPA